MPRSYRPIKHIYRYKIKKNCPSTVLVLSQFLVRWSSLGVTHQTAHFVAFSSCSFVVPSFLSLKNGIFHLFSIIFHLAIWTKILPPFYTCGLISSLSFIIIFVTVRLYISPASYVNPQHALGLQSLALGSLPGLILNIETDQHSLISD